MLEKIGLPAKPSLRGNNWVVDGSHCQGCSNQFTFINRKHHCRRCGGLFCNSCTQQRMVLRGQGDSPVRICEPCRKLEEAARFERRYGHKNKIAKGGSKQTVTDEDELLNQILGSDRKELSSSGEGSNTELVRGLHKATSSTSPSNVKEGTSDYVGEERLGIEEPVVETSPEEMRQQALDEKKRYRTLKAEGKSDEALKAFKRAKELERQASALELLLRKNRRKVLSSSTMPEILESNDENAQSGRKGKIPQKGKEKDDLAAELKELGWSDMDLRDAEKKPAATTLEGELYSLIGEVSQKTNTGSGKSVVDKTQVIAHKRKALALKREGKLAEAKEELKLAKALEKKLEEEEFLADADDESDDELSALIRSMDNDKHENLFAKEPSVGLGFENLMDFSDDLDGNLEVTDQDLEDPEMAAALQSLGWAEDAKNNANVEPQSATIDKDALSSEIQSLKREALQQKRAGNSVEALELLRKAKLLEKDLENHATNSISNPKSKESFRVSTVESASNPKSAQKSRLAVQKELLGLKKRALALRREGKMDEADEELKKGKLLEQQLEEMDNNGPRVEALSVNASKSRPSDVIVPVLADEGDADVTDQDMHDPAYLSLLSNLGWKEEEDDTVFKSPPKPSTASVATNDSSDRVPRRSKGEIQKELLGLKRKALALRRQGETDEADELLQKAKGLETQLAEMEAPKREDESETKRIKTETSGGHYGDAVEADSVAVSEEDMHDPALLSVLQNLGWKDEVEPATRQEKASPLVPLGHVNNEKITHEKQENSEKSESTVSQKDETSSIRQEILLLKRKALALKREGKLAEAREELRKAKLLEKSLEDDNADPSTTTSSSSKMPTFASSSTATVAQKEQTSPVLASKPMSSRDRFKLQQESLGHKRTALKLRREGRTEEADAEFELAKALEAQLEESVANDSVTSSKPVDDVGVGDFLDPQLMSALRAIGIENASSVVTQVAQKPEPVKQENSGQEIKELQEQIKAERLKAVNFKRSGNQAEALGALRRAKLLEKKITSLAS